MSERVYWALRWRGEQCWVGHHAWTPIKAARCQFETREDAAAERARRVQKKNIAIVRVTVRPKKKVAQLTAMVREFMAMVKQEMPLTARMPPLQIRHLRRDLILEELQEFEDALLERDLMAAVDALADLAYVVEGAFLAFGVDSAPILAEVHRSNMSKLGGGLDANGKATKGANYSAPDIAGELRKQGWKP